MECIKVVRHHTEWGFRVGLYDTIESRILYMGEVRTSKLPEKESKRMTLLRDATRRDIAKFRRVVRRFNGNTLRGIPKTVRKLIN